MLQSALADQALESAKDLGLKVDSVVLNRSKYYQKGNFDTATKSAVTGKAAGVMLYSLSSTTRSSAKEAKKAKQVLEKAKKEGKSDDDAKLILLVILAILLPPLAVFLKEEEFNYKTVLALVLCLLAIFTFALWLIPVLYALLVVFDVL